MRCTLVFDEDIENLEKLFIPELEQARTKRAGYVLDKKDGELSIIIDAKDFSSLKAFLTSVLRIVETYNKISDM